MLIVKTFTNQNFDKDNLDHLTLEEWEKCYEKLFGGFESLGEDDSDETDELDEISDSEKTKEGYHKDGFVVDDDDDEDEEYLPDDDEDVMKVKQKILKKQMKKLWVKKVILKI